MALYICQKCETIFDNPARRRYDDGALRESWDVCPTCGSEDFEAAARCRGCGEDMAPDRLIAGKYCENCVREAIMESGSDLVYEFLSEPDMRENFAEFLAERRWRPARTEG